MRLSGKTMPPPAGRSAFQPSLEKIPNNRRFDARSDHGASDRLEQDEGEMSAFDLLVLSHQRHQRVGIGQTFLSESANILQMGRQADRGKMVADARRL